MTELERGEQIPDDERKARQDVLDRHHVVALVIEDRLSRARHPDSFAARLHEEHDADTGREKQVGAVVEPIDGLPRICNLDSEVWGYPDVLNALAIWPDRHAVD